MKKKSTSGVTALSGDSRLFPLVTPCRAPSGRPAAVRSQYNKQKLALLKYLLKKRSVEKPVTVSAEAPVTLERLTARANKLNADHARQLASEKEQQ